MSLPLSLVLALAAVGTCHAQTASGAEAFDFLNLDANARAVGMGGAYTALANDSNALLYNPAGLGRLKGHEVTFMHNQYVEGLSQQYIGYAIKPGWGLNLNYLSFAGITRTRLDARDGTLGTFGVSDLALGGGYGHSFLDDKLSLGLGIKYLRETIDNLSANGFAADFGVMARTEELPGLTFGASLLNLGPDVRFLKDKEHLPATLRGGAAFEFTAAGTQNTLAFDVSKQRTDKLRAGIGAETLLGRVMALRVGFTTRNNTGIGLTGGVGWLWKTLGIDYAFVPFGDLGITHRVSLTFRWGSGSEDRPRSARSELIREMPGPSSYTIDQHLERADRFVRGKTLSLAKEELAAASAMMGAEDQRRILYHERLGQIALKEGDCPKAKGNFMEALKLASVMGFSDPSVADAYTGMGLCLLQQKNPSYALKFFIKALEANPRPDTRLVIQAQLDLLHAKK